MLSAGKDTDSLGNNLSDENIIVLINEFAKIDRYALKLMIELQHNKDFGQKDMVLMRMLRYLRDKKECQS